MNVLDFKTKVRRLIWPGTEAENLVDAHDNMFQESLQEIQKWVVPERDSNVDVIPFCATNYKCGLTIVTAPRGKIKQVFTIANGVWCQPVYYRQRDPMVPEQWARNIIFPKTGPDQTGLAVLPLGFQFAEKASDSTCGRAQTGIWSIRDRNINVAPWIQSNESLVIVWEGIKDNWADTDLVPDGTEFRKVVKLYVAMAHERDFGSDPGMLEKAKAFYDGALADFMNTWREFLRRVPDESTTWERNRYADEISLGNLPTPTAVNSGFACIGRSGAHNQSAAAVAALVNSWQPAYIISAGGTTYNQNYPQDVGSYYGSGLLPAAGKEDWDYGELANFTSYFNIPGNGRYYDVCKGEVHLFFLDTDAREPDGIISISPQARWLQAKLLLSTARWKIVVTSYSPHGNNGGNAAIQAPLQWPYQAWGADMVISASDAYYQRQVIGGFNYICNGIGGQTLSGSAPSGGNQVFGSNTFYGAMKFAATDSTLTMELHDTTGALQDSFTLTK